MLQIILFRKKISRDLCLLEKKAEEKKCDRYWWHCLVFTEWHSNGKRGCAVWFRTEEEEQREGSEPEQFTSEETCKRLWKINVYILSHHILNI